MTSLRCLVVDDHPFQRTVVRTMLLRLGINQVTEASDGKEALERVGAEPPDVVFCDLQMPSMDGVELLRHLGQGGYEGGVILMSGVDPRVLATAEVVVRSYRLTLLGALPKPVQSGPLRELLSRARRQGVPSRETAPPATPPLSPEEVRRALDRGEIAPFFQPMVQISSGEIVSAEALARWRREGVEVASPGAFIPVAEEHGLMPLLTEKMLEESLKHLSTWKSRGVDLSVSVNFSAVDLRDLSLPDRTEATAAAWGVSPESVTVELTESRVIEDLAQALDVLVRFRMKGFELAMDDFGTGSATLEQLRRIPFTKIKIDQMFVTGAASSRDRRIMLESSVSMAQRLGLLIIVEGVESREDWDLVTQLGCHVVQGRYVAYPMAPEDLPGWLASRRPLG